MEQFSNWLLEQSAHFRHIVVIAGNHDLPFDVANYAAFGPRFHKKKLYDPTQVRAALKHCTYLEDSEVVIDGFVRY